LKYDLIVIGAGSGGVRAARMAAQAGKKVAVVEYQALGGTCVNVGCVPKKLFVYASHFSETFKDAQGFGWTASKSDFSWSQLIKNKNEEILRLNGIYQRLLENNGVDIIEGKACFVNEGEILVKGKPYYAERFLVATGSQAFVPDIDGKEYFDTSNEMFYMEQLPKNILIVGGGFIAVEFAGILNGLGVETHLAYRGELFLRGFDKGVRERLALEMEAKGLDVNFNKDPHSLKKTNKGLEVSFKDGSKGVYERVLCATGRTPNVEGLSLAKAGVKLGSSGGIEVDECFQSNVSSIYALGDVIDRIQLTPVAIEEAMVFVNQTYGDGTHTMDYKNIPSAVFSQPNFSSVGLTEEEAYDLAKKDSFELEVYESEFRALKYTLTENLERTYMKLLVNKSTNKVIGAHMMGDEAAEVIQGLAIAIKAGATKADFDATVGIHPSSAEEFVTMRSPR
jgi:glutathione reductase (NADPH)